MDGGDQTVVISCDIEDGDGLGAADGDEIGMRENIANVCDGLPLGGGGHGDPCAEIGGGVRVLLGIVE